MKELSIKNEIGIIVKQVPDDYQFQSEFETFDDLSGFIIPDIVGNVGVESATQQEIEAYKRSLIPTTAKNMKFRLALIKSGISIKSIDDAIEEMPESPLKEQIKTLWEKADFFERFDPMLIAFAKKMGITDKQLDQLFILSNE